METAPYTLYILSEWSLLYLYYFCLSNRLVLDLATEDDVCQRSGNEDRKTETKEQIAKRMAKCKKELPCAYDYDYVVLNDDLDSCVRKVDAIIEAERQKVSRNIKNIDKIILGHKDL